MSNVKRSQKLPRNPSKLFLPCFVQHSAFHFVNKDLEMEIVNKLMDGRGGGIERLMEESPSVAAKRSKLNGSVKKLKEC